MTDPTKTVRDLLNQLVDQVRGIMAPGAGEPFLIPIVTAFSKALHNQSARFLTIHFRNPIIDEGRETRLIPGQEALQDTITNLDAILNSKANSITPDQATVFHEHLLPIYFGLIGRSDSFSDITLRALAHDKEATSYTYTFNFIDDASALNFACEITNLTCHINVTKALQYKLLGWDGKSIEDAQPKDCKLLYPLYEVVWDNVKKHCSGTGDRLSPWHPDVLRKCREELEAQCFFASREAFILSEAAKLIRDNQALNFANLIFEKLFARHGSSESTAGHGQDLTVMEQVLAMIQAVAIYAPVSSNEFTLLAHKNNLGYPFASGLLVGTSAPKADSLRGIVELLTNTLESRCTGLGLHQAQKCDSSRIQDQLGWIKEVQNVLHPKLIEEGLTQEVFDCVAYCAEGLLGKRHENERLSFRLAVGTDEALRQGFTPLFGKSGLAENDVDQEFFRVRLNNLLEKDDWERLVNNLDRLISVIEGNYSFIQDRNLYLCMAYAEQGLEIRYLARPNPRIQRAQRTALPLIISQLEEAESLSKVIPNIILSFLNEDDSGYIAFEKRDMGYWK